MFNSHYPLALLLQGGNFVTKNYYIILLFTHNKVFVILLQKIITSYFCSPTTKSISQSPNFCHHQVPPPPRVSHHRLSQLHWMAVMKSNNALTHSRNFAFYAFSFDQLTRLRLPLSLLLTSKKVMERGTNVRGRATRPLLDEERTENFCNRDDGNGSGSSCSDASSFTIVLVFSVAVVFCGSFTLGCAVSTISCR